ncbi:MAG TPA: PepSY-associated TM helix domain-containing protein [Bryobacteraceae bacterium]|nr:PepSY-associated TM helix domain-containing protein [Bryobacteraceae bacterium]
MKQTAIRKVLFWLHLLIGVTAGLFIFVMASTGVVLAFERQIVEFVDRDVRSVSAPNDAQPRPLNQLLEVVRRSGMGEPTAIVIRNWPQAAVRFLIGRSKTVYVDPYGGAVLGVNSVRAHDFFFAVERLHRALGAPLGSKTAGHWLAAVSNLLFGALILLGVILWLPRKWNWNTIRSSIAFRTGLRGRAREWNWHNVIGIWCALPLLVIVLTGVVMSFEWANVLLFRLTASTPPSASGRDSHHTQSAAANEPNYEYLFMLVRTLNPDWRTITLNVARDARSPVQAVLDTGYGGQPQKRTQYVLNRYTGAVLKKLAFADGSLGQRLRAFVRFGHTGEYGGFAGQTVAALVSLGACLLVYTGLSLSIRRLTARLRRKRQDILSARDPYVSQSVS